MCLDAKDEPEPGRVDPRGVDAISFVQEVVKAHAPVEVLVDPAAGVEVEHRPRVRTVGVDPGVPDVLWVEVILLTGEGEGELRPLEP